jgi:hypothetical protein
MMHFLTTSNTGKLAKPGIAAWLKGSGLSFNAVESGRWQIQMQHGYAAYVVNVIINDNWLSFAAVVMGSAHGPEAQHLYKFALSLNASINAAHIAFDNNRIMLVSNALAEDAREDRFLRDLAHFHQTHEYVFGYLLHEAERLHVQLRY